MTTLQFLQERKHNYLLIYHTQNFTPCMLTMTIRRRHIKVQHEKICNTGKTVGFPHKSSKYSIQKQPLPKSSKCLT